VQNLILLPILASLHVKQFSLTFFIFLNFNKEFVAFGGLSQHYDVGETSQQQQYSPKPGLQPILGTFRQHPQDEAANNLYNNNNFPTINTSGGQQSSIQQPLRPQRGGILQQQFQKPSPQQTSQIGGNKVNDPSTQSAGIL
jgi:hypothetical protein